MCIGTLIIAALLLILAAILTIWRCFHPASPNAAFLCAVIRASETDEKPRGYSTVPHFDSMRPA